MPDHMDARTRDRLKAFCKVGRLFDAQRLLEEVGTAKLRKTRKWTPLFTAVDRGFHSLVELLLRYEHAQWDLDKAYEGAQRRHRSDLAALILAAPSWSLPIDPVEILSTGDLGLARKLQNAGADPANWRAVAEPIPLTAFRQIEFSTEADPPQWIPWPGIRLQTS